MKMTSRGRPKGSANKAQTHGAQRAKEYGELLADGINPAVAARRVAEQWGVAEVTVYTDYKRHTASGEDVVHDFLAILQLVEGGLDNLAYKCLAAIKGVDDEEAIRALLRQVVESELDQIGDKAPHVTRKSTTGGRFRDGLKKKPIQK